MLRLLVGLQLLLLVGGFSFFQTRIPNGDRIPHPCWPNYLWHGVGHRNVAGGGARNPFGMDFDKAGKVGIFLFLFSFISALGGWGGSEA